MQTNKSNQSRNPFSSGGHSRNHSGNQIAPIFSNDFTWKNDQYEIVTNYFETVSFDKVLNLKYTSKRECYEDTDKWKMDENMDVVFVNQDTLRSLKEEYHTIDQVALNSSVLSTSFAMHELNRIPMDTFSESYHSVSDVLETIGNEIYRQGLFPILNNNVVPEDLDIDIEIRRSPHNDSFNVLNSSFDFLEGFEALSQIEAVPPLLEIFCNYQRAHLPSQRDRYLREFIEYALRNENNIESFSHMHKEICHILSNQFIRQVGDFLTSGKHEQLIFLTRILLCLYRFNTEGHHHFSENFPKSLVLFMEKLKNSMNNISYSAFSFVDRKTVDMFLNLGIQMLGTLNATNIQAKSEFHSEITIALQTFRDKLLSMGSIIQSCEEPAQLLGLSLLVSVGTLYTITQGASADQTYKELLIHHSKLWKKILQLFPISTLSIPDYCVFSKLLVFSICNLIAKASQNHRAMGVLVRSTLLLSFLTALESKECTLLPHYILVQLSLMDIIVYFLISAVKLYPSCLHQFKGGYNILKKLFSAILSLNEEFEEAIIYQCEEWVHSQLKATIFLTVSNYKIVPKLEALEDENQTLLSSISTTVGERLPIISDLLQSRKKKGESPTHCINPDIMQILLVVLGDLAKGAKRKSNIFSSVLLHLSEILMQYKDEYYSLLYKLHPLERMGSVFPNLNSEMQDHVLYMLTKFIDLDDIPIDIIRHSSSMRKIRLPEGQSSKLSQIGRDIHLYLSLLIKVKSKVTVKICKHMIQQFSEKGVDMMQTLFRLAHFPNIVEEALYKFRRRSFILEPIIELLTLYAKNNYLNHASLLRSDSNLLNLAYDLIYRHHDLVIPIVALLENFVILDRKQKWNIIEDMINILDFERKPNQSLDLDDSILKMLNVALVRNRYAMSEFKLKQGYKSLINHLYKLQVYTNSANKEVLLRVSISNISLLKTILKFSLQNKYEFISELSFNDMLPPLQVLEFIRVPDIKISRKFCFSLIELGLLYVDSISIPESEERPLQDLISDFMFRDLHSVMTLHNPEIITDVLLNLLADAIQDENTFKIGSEIFETLIMLSESISNIKKKLTECHILETLLGKFRHIFLNGNHELHSVLLRTFECFAEHCITVSELQMFFSMVALPNFPEDLLHSIIRVCHNENIDCPIEYLDFVPISVGKVSRPKVKLPVSGLSGWPSKNGNTFSLWVCIESISANSIVKLLQMRSTHMNMSLIVDSKGQLVVDLSLKNYSEHGRNSVAFGFIIPNSKWIHISITHQSNFSSQGETLCHAFTLHVNGVKHIERQTIQVQNSTFVEKINQFFKRSNMQSISIGKSIQKEGMYGSYQIGHIYLFEDILDIRDLYLLYTLGPNYVGSFSEPDISRFIPNTIIQPRAFERFEFMDLLSLSQTRSLQHLTSKVLFIFSARDVSVISKRNLTTMKDARFFIPSPKLEEVLNEEDESQYPLASPESGEILSPSYSNPYFASPLSPQSIRSRKFDDEGSKLESLPITYCTLNPICYGPSYDLNSGSKLKSSFTLSTITSSEFSSIRAEVFGAVETVRRGTLKSNLENVGGIKGIIAMLGIPSILSRFPHLIIYLLSQLLRGNSCNQMAMNEMDGYDVLKYVLQKDGMRVDEDTLLAVWDLCGYNVFGKKYVKQDVEQYENQYDLFQDQVLRDFIAFEKIILNYKIWKRASLQVQKDLYEIVLHFLTSHAYSPYHKFAYDATGVLKKLLITMEQCFLLDQFWPRKVISPVIEIIRNLIPVPATTDKYVFPLCKYILSTHPNRDSFSSGDTPQDARNAVLQLLLDIMEKTQEIIEELNTDGFLPISTLVIMTRNSNSQSRLLLLKIISLYLIYLPTACRVEFSKQRQINTLAAQLKQFDVELEELQIFFNLLLQNGFVNNTKRSRTSSFSLKRPTRLLSLVMPVASRLSEENVTLQDSIPEANPKDSKTTGRRGLRDRAYSYNSSSSRRILSSLNSLPFQELSIPPNLSSLESFFISDMLLGILLLIPSLSNSQKRLHTLKTLLKIFMECKPRIKESFYHWKLHTHLIKYISHAVVNDDKEFMNCVTQFFIEYLLYALNEQKFEVFSDSLTYFNVVEGSDENFVFSMQTLIIHSLLERFEQRIMNSDDGSIDMPFAEFCRMSVDHLVRFENNRFETHSEAIDSRNDTVLLVRDWYLKEYDIFKQTLVAVEGEPPTNITMPDSLFLESLHDSTALHFWLLDIIYRWLDFKQSKYGVADAYHQSTPEFLISRTIYKFILFLLHSNSPNNIIFSLLSLLHVKKRGDSPSLLIEACDQQVLTKQIIIFVMSLYSRKDPFITRLANIVLKELISTQKSFILNMFTISPANSNFFDELAMCIELNPDAYVEKLVRRNAITSTRDTIRQDSNKANGILTKHIQYIANEERTLNEFMVQAASRQQTISSELLTKQSEYKKILLKDMRKDDHITLSNDTQWRQLVKELLLSECTLINAFESLKRDSIYFDEPLRKYTEKSYSIAEYKLDFISGPERVCVRLKKRPRYLLETYFPSLVHDNNTYEDTDDSSRDDSQSSVSTSSFRMLDEIMLKVDPIQCNRITPLKKYSGELFLTEKHIYFIPIVDMDDIASTSKTICMEYELIREIHLRRYMYKNKGIEIFLSNGRSYFIAFESEANRDSIYNTLIKANRIPDHVDYDKLRQGSILQSSITDKWVNGEVSNFEYLLHINILAGRSFNDLTQYPVFPWILADYSSEELDLTNPKVFRDLSKPMGALSEKRKAKAVEKYENLKEIQDPHQPPYHWGTHYSTPIAVAYYLIRLEPYTRCMYNYNDEKLDVPGRTFQSIEQAYLLSSGYTGSHSDVKELIPEFFFLPEFLENRNRISYGKLENDIEVSDMILPPWAHGSAVEFVRKHREALESEFVSQNLHHWINLIFGYKQRGEKAVEAVNVFYHYTYEDCTQNIDLIHSESEREAAYEQIRHYGQCPHQLFKKPHPQRKVTKPTPNHWVDTTNREKKHDSKTITSPISPTLQTMSPASSFSNTVSYSTSKSIKDKQSRKYKIHNLQHFKEPVGDLRISKDGVITCVGRNKVLLPPIEKSDDLKSKFSEKENERDMRVVVYDTRWDRSLQILKLSNGKICDCIHSPIRSCKYTCHHLSKDGQLLTFGTDQGSVALYKLNPKKRIFQGSPVLLCGHSKRVNCVDISHQYSICVSASEDKSLIVWDLNKNRYMHSIRHKYPISLCAINNLNGDILITTRKKCSLFLYTINGTLISEKHSFEHEITAIYFISESLTGNPLHHQNIVLGMSNADIKICDPMTLVTLRNIKMSRRFTAPITRIAVSKSAQNYMVTCDENGVIVTYRVS